MARERLTLSIPELEHPVRPESMCALAERALHRGVALVLHL
jgi:hypothetical protein